MAVECGLTRPASLTTSPRPLSLLPPLVCTQTEPYEHVVIDVDEVHSGMVIERMAGRKGNMEEFHQMGPGKVSAKGWER